MSTTYDRIDLLEMKLRIAVEALKALASLNDKGGNEHLAATGRYSAFDEPGATMDARAALKAIDEARIAP